MSHTNHFLKVLEGYGFDRARNTIEVVETF